MQVPLGVAGQGVGVASFLPAPTLCTMANFGQLNRLLVFHHERIIALLCRFRRLRSRLAACPGGSILPSGMPNDAVHLGTPPRPRRWFVFPGLVFLARKTSCTRLLRYAQTLMPAICRSTSSPVAASWLLASRRASIIWGSPWPAPLGNCHDLCCGIAARSPHKTATPPRQ